MAESVPEKEDQAALDAQVARKEHALARKRAATDVCTVDVKAFVDRVMDEGTWLSTVKDAVAFVAAHVDRAAACQKYPSQSVAAPWTKFMARSC